MAHSLIGPSKADRWSVCTASPHMEAAFLDEKGEEAAWGDATHWIGAEVLQGRGAAPFEGRTAPNGLIVTDEMVDVAKVYVAAIHSVTPMVPATERVVEQPITIDRVHKECFGTPDCWWYDEKAALLHVWDLKTGYGIVEPKGNLQLILYAIGIVDKLTKKRPTLEQQIRVTLTIVQPRAYHFAGPVRSWTLDATDLRNYANRLWAAANEVYGNNPMCQTGEHCRYCKARHACPACREAAAISIDYSSQPQFDMLDNASMAVEYAILKRANDAISYRLKALESRLIAAINNGTDVPGWMVQQGTGHAQWSLPADQIIALGDTMGIDLRATQEAISPTDAKKKHLPLDIIQAFTSKSSTGLKLVPSDSTLAARCFGQK